MRPGAAYVARHIDRDPNALEAGTVYDLVTAVLGLIGFALFGIGLEVGGGVWPAIGFVVCIAVVAVSGFNLAPSARIPGVDDGVDAPGFDVVHVAGDSHPGWQQR